MTYPISEQPTWQIRDSSKLDDFISCNRYYFFCHMLGWRPDQPAHDLHFGASWHKAREHQLVHGYADVQGAYEAFITEYRKEFEPETDELYRPKDPTAVLGALMKFAAERERDLIDNELLYTEIGGTVPIDDSRVLYYLMDSILRRREDDKIFSWDHKTTHEKYINGRQWEDNFFLGIQNGTYTHCLYCIFPIEEVIGIEFCGTGFTYLSRNSKNRSAGYHCTLKRVPAYKAPDQMNVWLWNVNNYINQLDRETDKLSFCKESDEVLMAFPLNPGSCTKYRGCVYHDFCMSWANPLRRCPEPPLGFKIEFWDPSAREIKNKMDLEWRK